MWTHWEEGQRNPGDLPKYTLWGFEVRSEFKSRAEGMLSKQRCSGLVSTNSDPSNKQMIMPGGNAQF